MSVPMTRPETVNFLLNEIKSLEFRLNKAIEMDFDYYVNKITAKIADVKNQIVNICADMGIIKRTGRTAELNTIDNLSKKIVVLQNDLENPNTPANIKTNQMNAVNNYKLQIKLACVRLNK